MNQSAIEPAAKELGNAIVESMESLRKKINPETNVYAVVLVVLDDLSDFWFHANTEENFARSKRTDLDRWYFGQFWSSGLSASLDFSVLTRHLGEVVEWHKDEAPDNSNVVEWLVAMTLAMRNAREQGAFTFNGRAALIYCSIVDSRNAIWLEDLSAKFLNSADAYASAALGIKSASSSWYRAGIDEGFAAFRTKYESYLN
jgi:hypothetical protein